jgi:thiol-disulfide isomerase/thioredoxin
MKIRAQIALAASIGLAISLSAQEATPVMAIKGKVFPEFRMRTLEDQEFTNKNFKDKVTVINFWATWCDPKQAGTIALQKIHEDMKDKGVQVVGVDTFERGADGALDYGPKTAAAYVNEHKLSYIFTYGNTDFALKLKVQTLPTFMIIDQKGVVQEVMVGFDEAKLQAAIKALLPSES